MRVVLLTAIVLVAVLQAAGVSQQTPDLSAIVAQFYPQSLDADLIKIDAQDVVVRNQCYAVLESDGQGNPQTVLAAYANVYFGAVRILRRNATGFEVAADSAGESLSGSDCQAEAIDIDNDGAPEAHVTFALRTNSADWIYAWRNGALVSLTPVASIAQANENDTLAYNARLVDLDGDRILELYSRSIPSTDPSDPIEPSQVFRLSGGSYALDRPVITLSSYERTNEAPVTLNARVRLPAGATGPFTLRVINGSGPSGNGNRVEDAVNSGRIWLNGLEIVRPNDFGNQVSIIQRTVTLQADNELSVRLAGAPGGRITVVIDAASWSQ